MYAVLQKWTVRWHIIYSSSKVAEGAEKITPKLCCDNLSWNTASIRRNWSRTIKGVNWTFFQNYSGPLFVFIKCTLFGISGCDGYKDRMYIISRFLTASLIFLLLHFIKTVKCFAQYSIRTMTYHINLVSGQQSPFFETRTEHTKANIHTHTHT